MINIEDIVRPSILNLKPYSSARDEFTGEEGVFLDANENPYGELNRYPDPYQKELKQKLAALKKVNANNIFVGNGSDEIIDLAIRIFCHPGLDKAITFSPTYGMYKVAADINDVELLQLPLNKEFQINIKMLDPYFQDDSIKLIFICSPNNPTGNLMNKEDIFYILNNFQGIVIIDEAYIDFAAANSLISLTNNYNNLIVCQTFSKAWGLAAARIGVAYANTEIIRIFNKVKPPYNVSGINQKAIGLAIDRLEAYNEVMLAILSEKERLKKELLNINCVKTIYPSDANFLLLEVNNANDIYNKLAAQKIITRNRNSQITNCLRITIGTPEESDRLLNALRNIS